MSRLRKKSARDVTAPSPPIATASEPLATVDVRLPPGVRDFLPRASARRTRLADEILERFFRWGYQRIITPQFEIAEVLERGLGANASQAAIRFIEPEVGDVALLRPDMTPQVARIAATRLDETGGPLRLCYEGTVVRGGRGARQRELLQAGVELIGAPSPSGDSEMVALAAEVLLEARHSDRACCLEVGHVGPAQSLLAAPQLGSNRDAILTALVKRDLSAMEIATADLDATIAEPLRRLPRLSGPLSDLVAEAETLPKGIQRALGEIAAVLEGARLLAPKAMSKLEVIVDLGEVGSFPYYTGVRIAGWMDGVGDAILVGGRYDNLVARFGRDRKATGFAVNIEALAQAKLAAGERVSLAEGVLVVGNGEKPRQLAAALRKASIRSAVEIGGLRGKAAILRYAEQAGFAATLFISGTRATVVAGSASTKVSEALLDRCLHGDRTALKTVFPKSTERNS